MKPGILLLALFAVTAAILAAPRLIPQADPGTRELESDGRTRTYVVRHPEKTKGDLKLPVLIVLHGGGGNAKNAEEMTQLTPFAAKNNFIVVYANGTGARRSPFLTWNSGNCCAYAYENKVDDIDFISKMIDALVKDENADPKRIYVTGMSNGGMMTHRVGVELSDKVAAIAPVAAALNCDLQTGSPVPILMIHGDADQHVLIGGGKTTKGVEADRIDTSLEHGVAWWLKRNKNSSEGETIQEGILTTTTHTGKAPVKTVVIGGEGHTWPGGKAWRNAADQPTQEVSANRLIWDFVKQFER